MAGGVAGRIGRGNYPHGLRLGELPSAPPPEKHIVHFYEALDPLVRAAGHQGGAVELLRGLSLTAEGYKEIWRRLADHLRERREAIAAQLSVAAPVEGPSISVEQVDDMIRRIHERIELARKSLIQVGIRVELPLQRAFRWAYLLKNGMSGMADPARIRQWAQETYDGCMGGPEFLQEIIGILEPKQDTFPEVAYLVGRVKAMQHSAVASVLRHHGIRTKSAAEVGAKTRFQAGEVLRPQRGREAQLRKRAKLSPMKREALRIKEAEERKYPYAGRRKDIADMKEHHPFFGSIAAANFARELTANRRPWLHAANAYLVEVPSEWRERFAGDTIYIEPDFLLPTEGGKQIILTKRGGRRRGEKRRRIEELHALQEMRPDLNLELVDDLHYEHVGVERTTKKVRVGAKGVSPYKRKVVPGDNIRTQPQRFTLPVEACPCPLCTGKRMGEAPLPRGGFPTRRRRR